MAYQALYRVWRSQRFDDVVGQKAITQTLKNAIVQRKHLMPIYLLALVVQVKPVPKKFSLKRLTVNIVKMVNLVMFVKPV